MLHLLIALSVCHTIHGQTNTPPVTLQFEQVTSIQGLSNNTVLDITQDAESFIWFATREGLNKFDGQVITSYYKTENAAIPGNFIEKLLITSHEQMIIGTQKGVSVYHKETDSFSQILFKGKSIGNTTQIIELHTGELLLSSFQGLFIIGQDLAPVRISNIPYRDICEFRNGIIWGLYEDEIIIMNMEGEIIRRYSNDNKNLGSFDFSSANIECFFKDSKNNLWLGTKRNGIGYYDQQNDKFYHLQIHQGVNPIEDNFVRVINEDMLGRLWIGTESGLYIYDVQKEQFSFYGQSFDELEKGLNDKAIYSIFRSNDNLMWIGTYFGGVNYTSLTPNGFNRIYADGGENRLSGNAVSEIIEAADGKIWIGTEDGGISILDPHDRTFSYLKHIPGDAGSLSSNNVHALEQDAQGRIWIGTFLGGLNRYDPATGKFELFELIPRQDNMQEDVYNKSVFSVCIDSKGRTWAGSIGGLYMREKEGQDFKLWNPALFEYNFIYHIEEDAYGIIWAATYEEGIYRINPDNSVNNYRTDNKHNILSNRIVYILPADKENIWFGTVDGGLVRYSYASGMFTSFTTDNGLPNNTVYAITKDENDHLWLSTNRGISKFKVQSETFVNYSENDGLIGNQFNFKSGLKTSSGTIYFGAVNGLTFFDPENIRNNDLHPVIHLTDLKIFNNSVPIGEESILSSHINFQDEISLKYSNKVFSIDFVALNYISPKNVRYAYYLEGLEEDWNYVGNKQTASYTNLSPGSYTFHLKAACGSDFTTTTERTLGIDIRPPFYMSVWGYMLFGVLLVGTTLLIIRFYSIRQRDKMNVRIARLESEKNEEISQHRLNFFTYISHEFKTPLTLIIATLEHIMNYENVLPRFKDYSLLMRKNAMRLLFLINQLMDFRKIETDHASLSYNKGEIIAFLKSTFMAFKPLMQKQLIKSAFTSNVDSYIVYFEADKLEKILANLISNSCKSFKKPGTIAMDVKITERTHLANPAAEATRSGDLIITIIDDGPGMPKEKLEHIYKPFISADPSDFYSSGIGLSLVNSLVKYLNGKINITSSSEKGTSVVIQLPLVHDPDPGLIKSDTFIENNVSFDPEATPLFTNSEEEITFDFQDNGTVKEYGMLIVEDNNELASFLQHHFAPVFNVQIAYDGEQAYKKIRKNHPDLVISDIMMPRMDGYALCSAIKDSVETSHIPVILLTSKTRNEARQEGFFKGADAYVGKPFNLRELDLQVRNILRFRENLRNHFASFGELEENVTTLGNKDQMLIKSLTATVHKHLDNGSFDVDMFCKETNLSRTLLHMKLKKITGLSATGFIKNIRLNEARKMLQEHNLTVAEISYRVGYNDPAYFSKTFKKFFGKSPSEIHDNNG
ncbi:MAG: two-component regulator propeller domain-containing protein [Bacteroidales bacterium]|nr:two-component regulator propeller domain-containing protein [Bacteroidales bacterium]